MYTESASERVETATTTPTTTTTTTATTTTVVVREVYIYFSVHTIESVIQSKEKRAENVGRAIIGLVRNNSINNIVSNEKKLLFGAVAVEQVCNGVNRQILIGFIFLLRNSVQLAK